MKVLHINSYFNGSRFYKNLYDKQKEDKLDMDVFVPVPTSFKDWDLDFGDYTRISANHGSYDRILFHLKHGKILADIQDKYTMEDYSLVHAHSLFSNGYIAYNLYKKYKLPYIVAVRNTDVNVFFKKMIHLRKMGRDILKNAERVIFLSQPYRDYTIDTYVDEKDRQAIRDKSLVIPNGIDDFWQENLVEEKTPPGEGRVRLIYVGTLDENKNIEATIEACEKLIDQGYHVSYRIVGRMKDEKYRTLIKDYPFIEYCEHCSKEDLIAFYRDSDIFVMPSKRETFGIVYPEAMSQGLPVIYSRGQGFDGQFEEGRVGYSVRSDQSKDIVARVRDILGNYQTISKNARKEVKRYKWDAIAKEYIGIYEDIYGSKKI